MVYVNILLKPQLLKDAWAINSTHPFAPTILLHWTRGEEVLLELQQTLAPSLGAPIVQQHNILLNIASIAQSSNTAAHTLSNWSILIVQ